MYESVSRWVRSRARAWLRLLARVDRDDLAWLADQVWGSPSASAGWWVDEPPPAGWTATDRYLVLPGADRPLVVVPRLTRRSVVRALSARPGLQSRANLAVRLAAAGVVAVTGTGTVRAPGGALVVGRRVGAAGTPPDGGSVGLAGLLCERLGVEVSVLVLPGRRDPNRKPTLELVDRAGSAVGFAKVGWNAPTRDLVRNEAAQLERLASLRRRGTSPHLPASPGVLAALELGDSYVLVTVPMPTRARARPNAAPPPNDAMLAVAATLSPTGTIETEGLHGLAVWDRHRTALAAECTDPEERSAAEVLARALADALRGVDPGTTVPVGGWHGDWAPWNLATAGSSLWAWDWEHAGPDVPLGFDLLHYRFQVAVDVAGSATTDAVAALRAEAPAALAALGVPPAAAQAVVTGYLVEVWLRARQLRVGGGGWNPAIHPGIPAAIRP